MRKTKETVYRCEYCNKAMVSAGFMKLHERMCKENPKNKHQCFKYCGNLVKDNLLLLTNLVSNAANLKYHLLAK